MKNFFIKADNSAGLKFQTRMKVSEAAQFMSLLRLSNTQMRGIRTVLNKTGVGNFWPSEPKIRDYQESLTTHISDEKIDYGTMKFRLKDDKIEDRPYFRVKELKSYIEHIIENTKEIRSDLGFEGKMWLHFSWDKGGSSMKFHVEVLNDVRSGSRGVVDVFALFSAPDSIENMWKVFSYYVPQIKMLQDPNFELRNGLKVKVFLGGDLDYLSKCLGHQGQAATFPSLTDRVTLDHLRNHTG